MSRIMRNIQAGFTLIEFVIVLSIIGILAAIAIPNYTKFVARANQSEAKANLRDIYIAKHAYYTETDTFICPHSGFCDWNTSARTRYTYQAGAGSNLSTHIQTAVDDSHNPCGAGAGAAETDKSFTVTANGNIDGDDICDHWTIDDTGELINITNDVIVD